MDHGACRATAHVITGIRHDLATITPQVTQLYIYGHFN